MTTVVITGAHGFVGRNLRFRLAERGRCDVVGLGRSDSEAAFANALARADFVFHLAGVNRPLDPKEFEAGNVGVTERLCAHLANAGNDAPIVYASSSQAGMAGLYGQSKRAGEDALLRHSEATGAPVHLFRLPNIFGKWARPNYNSAVATFCHNIAHGLGITVHDPAAPLRLVYIDDVTDAFLALLDSPPSVSGHHEAGPVYETNVGSVAEIIRGFPASRVTLITPRAGTGLLRALYATYLSYLDPVDFAYAVPVHGREDPRGVFVEFMKTPDTGQFSYFTAPPGATRGDHYHHTKAEKFLVIAGLAHFGFRHVDSGEKHEVVARGGEGRIVETIPGWTHNITNIGANELIVLLWANEVFDRARPDTFAMRV